jgi:predicted permease
MDRLSHDLRGAFRHIQRSVAFSTAVVLILALGIAAVTTTFSATEALLFRHLPYPNSDRLVSLRSVAAGHLYERVSAGALADWQLQASSFDSITGYRWYTADVLSGTEGERLNGLFATPEFFDVFGVPLQGRGFVTSDRGTRTLVLGQDVWRRRFNADPSIVRSSVNLNVRNFRRVGPTPHAVVGVAATPVRFPPLTADFQLNLPTVLDTIDFFAPEFVSPASSRENPELDVVGRLATGVTLAQAQAEMDAIVRRQALQYPRSLVTTVRLLPLRDHIVGRSRNGLLLLAAGTWMLLLIACANVATLLLAHGAARRREVAIRRALGAPESRIVRQFLLETVILAALAGGVGIAASYLAIEMTRPLLPRSLPLLSEMHINAIVASFAAVCALLTACLTGIIPALRITRGVRDDVLGRQRAGVTATREQTRLTRSLVALEVALVLILMLGTALLGRSAVNAWRVDPGFDPANLLTMTVSLPENKFDWNHNAMFAGQVVESVSRLPAVDGAAVIQGIPMRSGSFYGSGTIEGFVPRGEADKPAWRIRVVSPEYFEVMRIPIVKGRALDARDEQGEVGYARNVVVSNVFAQRYWPGEDPIGRRIGSPDRWETVIGVAGDLHYAGLEADATADVYYPQRLFPQAAITLVVRTRGNPLNETSTIRSQIRSIDQDAFVTNVASMEEVIGRSQAQRRAGTFLVAVLSALGLVLVLVGIYSVIAQSVIQRRVEIAIRMALGAEPWRVLWLVMQTALSPAVIGVAGGLLGGAALTRFIASLLFGVDSSDWQTWLAACALVLTTSVLAGYLAARRATLEEPMTVLKAD